MHVTRRYWGTAGVGAFLALLAVVLAQPLLLVGGVGIGAWLLVQQYQFVHALSQVEQNLSIEQSLSQDRVIAGNETTVALSARLPSPSPLAITIAVVPPVSATSTDHGAARLECGETSASTALTVEWAVAGSYEFGVPELTLTDAAGLFHERLSRGPTPTVVVEPSGPHDVHVGAGGDQLMIAYGERESGRRDAGLDPGELREYVPGDAAGRIDWKATARMNEPYVREYEVETDCVTALLVDHRGPMADGPTGETKLDYARQVALTFVDSVREYGDPLGYYTVGDDGITGRRQPTSTHSSNAVSGSYRRPRAHRPPRTPAWRVRLLPVLRPADSTRRARSPPRCGRTLRRPRRTSSALRAIRSTRPPGPPSLG
jgi:uncharacterized protein (DUF58 family)